MTSAQQRKQYRFGLMIATAVVVMALAACNSPTAPTAQGPSLDGRLRVNPITRQPNGGAVDVDLLPPIPVVPEDS